MKYTILLLISCLIACNTPKAIVSTDSGGGEGLRGIEPATASKFYFVSNLYTDSSYAQGQRKYVGLPNPQRFWLIIRASTETYKALYAKYYKTMPLDSALHDIGEAFGDMFFQKQNNLPFHGEYDWVYIKPAVPPSSPTEIQGIYVYLTPAAQREILPATKTGIHTTIQAELDEGRYTWKITQDQPINPPAPIPLLQQVKIQ